MTGEIPLRPIGSPQPRRVLGSPRPTKETDITIETLKSIGKQLVEDSTALELHLVDLPAITESLPDEDKSSEKIKKTWESKVKELSTEKLSKKENNYVDTASNALFLQWEAEERKERFLEIVEAKLSNSFQVTEQNSTDNTEFESMIDEIYRYAQLHGNIGSNSKIMQLIFPTYSYPEREKIIDYMYQSREAPNTAETKKALETFVSSPSSFKLVVVVKENQKYIEAQETTFFEKVFHFLFNVKTTNWEKVLPFLNECKVEPNEKPHLSDELQKLESQLLAHKQRYDSLMTTPLDVESMDNVDSALLGQLDQIEELAKLLTNPKKEPRITDATSTIKSIIQEKKAIEALEEKIQKIKVDYDSFLIHSSSYSEKQIVEILRRNFHT